jgi:3-oxoacyl-[acyl-carrier protein] reductase
MTLKGKTAIITGSARGIGKMIALELASQGANIVVSDLNEAEGKQVVDEINAKGSAAIWVKADVSKSDDAHQLIQSALDQFGQIDILVNNAGIKAATRTFMKQRSGRIINIASVVGQMGNAGQANYAASKAGIIGLTKSVAKELASRNICVNAVAPGFIQTLMTDNLPEKAKESLLIAIPLARLGQPEDVANVVSFLSDERSSYITGQVINVDGGMVM